MISTTSLRNGLLMASACALLAACSGGGSVQNNGSAGSVAVLGGGGSGTAASDFSFVPSGFTCPTVAPEGTVTSGTVTIDACVISGDILSNVTLPGTFGGESIGYVLAGSVFVGENVISNPSGASAVLEIGAGGILLGQSGEDALFINPGSEIRAFGTQTNPIVMTSLSDAADGDVNDGLVNGSSTVKGEWGGLVISGLARINDCDVGTATPGAADCNKTGEGGSGLFGGDNDADSSGTLEYVRVQYAGFLFNGEDELNGIAFQGVGSGTSVDFVQVHNGQDDGVEFFGGAVDAQHIVVTGARDDSIDWTDGWRGDLQYAIVVQDDISADCGIEGDNRSNDINIGDAEGLRSMPNVSNFTFLGSSDVVATPSDGIRVRAGTDGVLANGIVVGFGLGDGLDYDASTDGVASTGLPEVFSLFVAGNERPFDTDGGTLFNVSGSNNIAAGASTVNGLFAGPAEQGVTATDISGPSNDIEATDFVGAFDYTGTDGVADTPADNWTSNWTLANTIPGATPAACPTGTLQSADTVPFSRSEALVCNVPNNIESDITLTAGNLYKFSGSVFVGDDVGPDAENPVGGAAVATLTIEPGVTVYGENGEDAIIVTRGSRIVAQGTQTAPIVFTSETDILGNVTDISKGEWGGLVINGRAPINDCNVGTNVPGSVGCEKTGEGGSGLFGGNDRGDDSGVLSFVQVRYAGFLFNGEDELNGIAFQAVGSGTQVDHIHVHNGQDDAVEFFGGAVDADYVIVTGARDDSIDWTDGWTGSVQYALVVQDDNSADRGIEGDSRSNDINVGDLNADGNFDEGEVRSHPLISNFTLFGSNAAAASPTDGVRIRAGTDGILLNGIVLGFGMGDGLDYDASTDGVTNLATPEVFSLYVADNGAAFDTDGGTLFNVFGSNNVDGGVDRNMNGFIPNSTLQGLVTPTTFSTLTVPVGVSTSIEDTDYVGAFDPATETNEDNWTTGWSFNVNIGLDNVN